MKNLSMEKNYKKIVTKLGLWILGIGLVAVMVHLAGWSNIKRAAASVNPSFLLLLCIFQIFTLALSSYQLHYILRCSKIRLGFWKVFSIYMTGNLIENITPSIKFGGEAVKVYLLKKYSSSDYKKLAGVFIIYKLISILPFIAVLLISASLLYFRSGINIFIYVAAILSVSALGLFLILYIKHYKKKLPVPLSKIRDFLSGAVYFSKKALDKRQFGWMMCVSCFIWLAYPFKLYLITRLLGIHVDFISLAPILYASYMISMMPITPGGLGSFEASMVFMLGRIHVSAHYALTTVLLSRFVTYWFPLFFSAVVAGVLLFENRNFYADSLKNTGHLE